MSKPLSNDYVDPFASGRVEAKGSVWRLYFTDAVPSEEEAARALGAAKATKITESVRVALVTPNNK